MNEMKNTLQQIDEKVKAQNQYWESLSPEARREIFIKRREDFTKKKRTLMVVTGLAGLASTGVTAFLWFRQYNLSAMSTLGIVIGIVLASAGLIFLNSLRIKSADKLQSDNFTDEDVIAYFREHEKSNERVLNLQKNKFGMVVITILLGLLFYASDKLLTVDARNMILPSGISVFVLGFALFLKRQISR